MSRGRRWIVVVLLLLLHFALHPLWSRWTVGPDLLAGGVLLGSFLLRWGRAAVLGGLLGLLEASISLGPLGLTMFLFAVFACLSSWLRHTLYSESGAFSLVFLFVGTWALHAAVSPLMQGEVSLGVFAVYGPVDAALTTAACWVVNRFVPAGRGRGPAGRRRGRGGG